MTLYEISENYRNVLESLEVDENGEIVNLAALEEAEGQLYDKTEAVAIFIKELKAEAEMIAVEEKALRERKESKIKRAERLTEYLSDMMQYNNMPKFETGKVKLGFRKSEAVVIANEDEIPDMYMIYNVECKPDKASLKKALKGGEVIPGAVLEERQNLQVK